jgi:hypothetical protein
MVTTVSEQRVVFIFKVFKTHCHIYPEGEGSTFLLNVGNHEQLHCIVQPRTRWRSFPQYGPQISDISLIFLFFENIDCALDVITEESDGVKFELDSRHHYAMGEWGVIKKNCELVRERGN